jgi:stringent starvation protein B
MPDPSTKPYLIRAIHQWCTDSGFTPYIAVLVDEGVRVPHEFVKNGEIVLNICRSRPAVCSWATKRSSSRHASVVSRARCAFQ